MLGKQKDGEEILQSLASDHILPELISHVRHHKLPIECISSKDKAFIRSYSGNSSLIEPIHERLSWEALIAAGNNWPSLFIQQGHDAIHLADFIETMFTSKHPGWPFWIKTPLEQYKSNLQEFSLMPNDGHEREVEVMKLYLQLFDDILFFGLLSEHTQLFIVDIADLGLCYSPDGGQSLNICLKIQTCTTRLQVYITVLLHEMVHAFMQRFSCRCKDCVNDLQRCGKLGHGDAWCRIAYNVQGTVHWLFGLQGSMMIEKSYEKEVIAC